MASIPLIKQIASTGEMEAKYNEQSDCSMGEESDGRQLLKMVSQSWGDVCNTLEIISMNGKHTEKMVNAWDSPQEQLSLGMSLL